MRDNRIRVLAEMGLCIALFAILQYFNVRLPVNLSGGTVSLSMIPLIALALLRGPWVGLACGLLCGCVDLVIEPYFFHPVQVVLDYPFAFALVGVAGVFSSAFARGMEARKTKVAMLVVAFASMVGIFLRFGAHTLSGVVFFSSNAPAGQNVLWYSVVYNASYLLPSLGVTVPVMLAVMPFLYNVRTATHE